MYFRIALLALLASMLLCAEAPALAEVPSKEMRNCRPPRKGITYLQQHFWVGPGKDAAYFQLVLTEVECQGPDDRWRQFRRYGLWGGVEGKPKFKSGNVIEERYDAIAPYSPNAALVKREDGRWIDYSFGKGETGRPLLYDDVLSLVAEERCTYGRDYEQTQSPAVAVGLSAVDSAGKRTAYLHFGDRAPVAIPGLGGPGIERPVERHKEIVITRWTDPDGVVRHRLYSIGGRPISPVLGGVVRWATATSLEDMEKGPVCYGTEDVDLFVVGPSLDEDLSFPYWGPMLTPLAADGAPLALPEGAIGVVPVTGWLFGQGLEVPTKPAEDWPRYAHLPSVRAWAVIYPTATGYEFTYTAGTLAQALIESPSGERFTDIRLFNWDKRVRRDDPAQFFNVSRAVFTRLQNGLWQGRYYFDDAIRGAPAATVDAAYANYTTAAQEAEARSNALALAAKAKREAGYVADFEARMKDGTACRYAPPWSLGPELVSRHAAKCPAAYNMADLARLKSSGFSPELVATVERSKAEAAAREAQYRAEQAELARSYVPPGSWETALRIASDVQVRNIQQSTTNWLDQRRREYYADWQRSQRAY